ncbi:MAG TPA: class I SAM-dependent methyltransferase, partial [Gaiellales bacterium]
MAHHPGDAAPANAGAIYDEIGRTYAAARRADPRIQAAIWAAVGDAATVVNVGAGTGSYEPPATILAVEPSATMIAQRPAGSAPAVKATAEHIPLADGACDVALAVLTLHHWSDPRRGLAEMRRVARRLVVLHWDPDFADRFWLVHDYLPESVGLDRGRMPAIDDVRDWMGGADVTPVPVPHDCADGFFCANWRRPEAYLDPVVRAGASNLALLGPAVDRAVAALRADLQSGAWLERHRALLDLDELDL